MSIIMMSKLTDGPANKSFIENLQFYGIDESKGKVKKVILICIEY